MSDSSLIITNLCIRGKGIQESGRSGHTTGVLQTGTVTDVSDGLPIKCESKEEREAICDGTRKRKGCVDPQDTAQSGRTKTYAEKATKKNALSHPQPPKSSSRRIDNRPTTTAGPSNANKPAHHDLGTHKSTHQSTSNNPLQTSTAAKQKPKPKLSPYTKPKPEPIDEPQRNEQEHLPGPSTLRSHPGKSREKGKKPLYKLQSVSLSPAGEQELAILFQQWERRKLGLDSNGAKDRRLGDVRAVKRRKVVMEDGGVVRWGVVNNTPEEGQESLGYRLDRNPEHVVEPPQPWWPLDRPFPRREVKGRRYEPTPDADPSWINKARYISGGQRWIQCREKAERLSHHFRNRRRDRRLQRTNDRTRTYLQRNEKRYFRSMQSPHLSDTPSNRWLSTPEKAERDEDRRMEAEDVVRGEKLVGEGEERCRRVRDSVEVEGRWKARSEGREEREELTRAVEELSPRPEEHRYEKWCPAEETRNEGKQRKRQHLDATSQLPHPPVPRFSSPTPPTLSSHTRPTVSSPPHPITSSPLGPAHPSPNSQANSETDSYRNYFYNRAVQTCDNHSITSVRSSQQSHKGGFWTGCRAMEKEDDGGEGVGAYGGEEKERLPYRGFWSRNIVREWSERVEVESGVVGLSSGRVKVESGVAGPSGERVKTELGLTSPSIGRIKSELAGPSTGGIKTESGLAGPGGGGGEASGQGRSESEDEDPDEDIETEPSLSPYENLKRFMEDCERARQAWREAKRRERLGQVHPELPRVVDPDCMIVDGEDAGKEWEAAERRKRNLDVRNEKFRLVVDDTFICDVKFESIGAGINAPHYYPVYQDILKVAHKKTLKFKQLLQNTYQLPLLKRLNLYHPLSVFAVYAADEEGREKLDGVARWLREKDVVHTTQKGFFKGYILPTISRPVFTTPTTPHDAASLYLLIRDLRLDNNERGRFIENVGLSSKGLEGVKYLEGWKEVGRDFTVERCGGGTGERGSKVARGEVLKGGEGFSRVLDECGDLVETDGGGFGRGVNESGDVVETDAGKRDGWGDLVETDVGRRDEWGDLVKGVGPSWVGGGSSSVNEWGELVDRDVGRRDEWGDLVEGGGPSRGRGSRDLDNGEGVSWGRQ
ncbi:hypothetical protein HK097_006996 [Rhizophlyctis rosea]|uniref:Uncharacterized protein n=1 Tax=Rhizophlyctis rosea TaxID=64517 RepID=A0AAD5X4W6_9FUNG|nr:hypothetical protein HK097_006996 [Rhizophlyctis rosea]